MDDHFPPCMEVSFVDGKRRQKWHALTRVSEGLPALYRALAELSKPARATMSDRLDQWIAHVTSSLGVIEQKEMARKAAVVGKASIMDSPAPGGLGGTYAGSPIACAAALATLAVGGVLAFLAYRRAVRR